MLSDFAKTISASSLDLIYPRGLYCSCCDKIIDSTRPYQLCDDCMASFKWANCRTCSKCGKPLSKANTRDICFSCAEHQHFYRRGYTCTEYGSCERILLHKLKYQSDTSVVETIGESLSDMLIARGATCYDLIVPVPSHPSRRKARGYNQAELIAREVAKRLDTPCRADILARTVQTKALRSKTPDERRAELRGAFRINKGKEAAVVDMRILVVDDIYTTGATMDAVSVLLDDAGAEYVDIASFASGADVVK